jgi:hypothetical protein
VGCLRGGLEVPSLEGLMGADGLGVGAVLPLLVAGRRWQRLSVGVMRSRSWWEGDGRKAALMRLFPRLKEQRGLQVVAEGRLKVVQFTRKPVQ